MLSRIVTVASAVVMAFSVQIPGRAQQADTKKLSEAGVTVSYQAGMEAQAKNVLEIAKSSIKPALELQQRSAALLSNPGAVARNIVDLLGADEKLDETQGRLQHYKDKADALTKCFSDIRLVKKAAVAADGGIDAGILRVNYFKDKDEFSMIPGGDPSDPETVKKSFFPVVVNADGSIRSENKLADVALQFLGSGDGVVIGPVHETVGYILAEELKLFHPFSRWFNEGIAGWITRHVIARTDPKLGALTGRILDVSEKSRGLRAQVNLLAWPQAPFQNRRHASFDPALETAQTQYAVEFVTDILGRDAAATLPKIMNEVNYSGNPDRNTICKAVEKITGRNPKPVLLAYVPADIRAGIESGEARKLGQNAEALVGKKEWAKAAESLSRALQMAPEDVNLRLNFAYAEREVGERIDSEYQVFLVAALLKQGSQPFHLYADTLEGRYVLARLAVLVGNLETAKAFLQPLIEQKPDHKDAKRLMQEIDRLEKAAKEESG